MPHMQTRHMISRLQGDCSTSNIGGKGFAGPAAEDSRPPALRPGLRFLLKAFHLRLVTGMIGMALGLLLVGCPSPPPPQEGGVLWLQFAHITDTHSVDEESPARMVRSDAFFGSAWRSQEAYMAQTLDATLQVLNGHHTGALQPQRRLDFLLHTGDAADDAQYNEFRWFMDVMDGRLVQTDSGDLDGSARPVPAGLNPKLPFQAGGLLPEIPWYLAHGNHDTLCVGTFGIDRRGADPLHWYAPLLWPVAEAIGLHGLSDSLNALVPTSDLSPALITGDMDLADPTTQQLRWEALGSGPIPPDGDRRFMAPADIVSECFQSPSQPVGHGFVAGKTGPLALCYSVRPKADVPIRLIVLDTTAPAPPDGLPFDSGVMTRDQFDNFLKPEIRAARAAHEWVIIASHHPSSDFDMPFPAPTVGQLEFRLYLSSQPNVIAHVCGHKHRNHYELVRGWHSYPEIETCSLVDSPQEARIFGIYYVEEAHAFRVESTMVSHMEHPTALSAECYRRATNGAPAPEDAGKAELAAQFGAGVSGTASERQGRSEDRDLSVVVDGAWE